MLFSDSVIIIVEKLLPFKSLYLLVNASFRRRHVFFIDIDQAAKISTGNCPDRLGWMTAQKKVENDWKKEYWA